MADKKRTFRKFSYRGVDLDQLLEYKPNDVGGTFFLSLPLLPLLVLTVSLRCSLDNTS